MKCCQKIIKNLSIAFAIFLAISIISGILSAVLLLANITGLNKHKGNLDDINWEAYSDLTSCLDVDIAYSNLTIKSGEKFLAQSNNEGIQCTQDGNKIVIKEKKANWFSFSKKETSELTIYIPMNLEFEEVKISNGAGKVNIEQIVTKDLKLNLGAGETIIEKIITEKAKADTGTGAFTIKSGKISNLDFDIGIGESNITAQITGNNKIDTGIGAVNLNIIGRKDDYKISIDKGIGEVKIENEKISDSATIGNGQNNIKINSGIGAVNVAFNEE